MATFSTFTLTHRWSKMMTVPRFRPSWHLLEGVILGSVATAAVAVLTFVIHQHLPYRRMLVVTGVMLAVVLLVMVGEEAQEMQLAGWLPTTHLPTLNEVLPAWIGLWFSVFPTVETLVSQVVAGALVFGSYFTARRLPGMAR